MEYSVRDEEESGWETWMTSPNGKAVGGQESLWAVAGQRFTVAGLAFPHLNTDICYKKVI